MERILVTGATGLLGSSLVPALKQAGHEVIAHGNRGGEVRFDLTDRAATHAALDRARPSVIVNLVAATDVDRCEREPHTAYLLNVRTTENLAAWKGGSFLVQISTDQVYDGKGPQKESEIKLTNMYAFSKYTSELVALNAGGAVLRTNFFGRSRIPGRKSLSDWVVESLRGRVSISLFDDIWFAPLSFATLTQMVGRVAEAKKSGLYNLGSRDGMTKCGFALTLAKSIGLQTESASRTTSEAAHFKAYRPKDMRMDSTHFEQAFGVQLPTLHQEIVSLRSEYDS